MAAGVAGCSGIGISSAVPSTTASASAVPSPSSSASVFGTRTGLPDPSLTPGAIDPAVTQETIHATICVTGYTSTVRPPASYTGTLKRRQLAALGLSPDDAALYQEDHLVPLGIGGSPRDERNLWPQPLHLVRADGLDVGAEAKDGYELYLHTRVCDGRITLAAAQRSMTTDWIAGWIAAGRPGEAGD